MFYRTEFSSPLGKIILASDGEALSGLWFEGQKYFEAGIPEPMKENPELSIFKDTKDWLNRYFAGEKPDIHLPLRPLGSHFRQQVWKLLCEIPYGKMTTYGELGRKLEALEGKKTSARAVGGAVGHTPISILIPCHRVIGANGSLTGYAGGLERKIQLLKLEGISLEKLVQGK